MVAGPNDAASVKGGDPDWALLSAAGGGDEEAFATLVRRHQERLLCLCRRLLRDGGEAEEAVQEVFLKAYRKAAAFRPEARVSTWLYRIATNHCLNQLRRRRIVRFLPLADREGNTAPIAEPVDEAPGPLERVVARRRLGSIRRALDRLPPSQRTLVLLVKVEGLTYRQAAEVLGISLAAVESRLFRAMRSLEKSARND